MAKEFSLWGKSLKEMKELSTEEFARLASSRMRRSLKRHSDKPLMKRIEKALKAKEAGKEPSTIRTHKRDTVITPKFAGLKFAVYNGHEFTMFEVKPEMMGHMLGEFAMTRKRIVHGKAGIGATRSSTAVTARG